MSTFASIEWEQTDDTVAAAAVASSTLKQQPLSVILQGLAKNGLVISKWINEDGLNGLHVAAKEGLPELAEAILTVKAVDVNCKCKVGKTPLLYAAKFGRFDVVEILLCHGASVENGLLVLHDAAHRGHNDVVRLLIRAGADVTERRVSPYDNVDVTPAQQCCMVYNSPPGFTPRRSGQEIRKGKAECLRLILQHGGDMHESRSGESLLHFAARNDLKECITLLVEKGLHPDLLTDYGGTYNYTALHQACAAGSVEAPKELARLGANLEILDTDGRTPLFNAVVNRHDDCISAMIEIGANACAKDPQGLTLLHAAAAFGAIRATYLLLEAGADVRAATSGAGSYTPLMVCVKPDLLSTFKEDYMKEGYGSRRNRGKVLKLLLEMGAEVDGKVMQYAVEGGMNDIIAERMKHTIEMSNQNKTNWSTMADTLVAHYDQVVTVRLVNRTDGQEASQRYKLNTQLVERLTDMEEQNDDDRHVISGGNSDIGSPTKRTSTANVLSKLLDPVKYGFHESNGGGGDAKEVTLEYDGSDFTEEGFATVVKFLTTGSLDDVLVHKPKRRLSGVVVVDGSVPDDGSRGSHGSSSSSGGGGGSRRGSGSEFEGRCLFDVERAKMALQAAEFFCLERMTEEVKRLVDIFGFEYGD